MSVLTAVIPSWKRPDNIPAIADRLLSRDWIGELIVWDNNDEQPLEWQPDDVRARVVPSGRNLKVWGRYKAAGIAAFDHIYTQDDDVLPSVETLENLYANWLSDPVTPHAALAEGHYRYEVGRKQYLSVGWGTIFSRGMLMVFDAYLERYGEDELLLRKADKIFTVLIGQSNFRAIVAEYKRLAGDTERFSLYRQRDHATLTRAAIERCKEIQNGPKASTGGHHRR